MKESTNNNTPKGFFRTLSLIHMGLIGGLLVATAVFYLQTEVPPNTGEEDLMIYVFPTIAILSIFLSKFLFAQQLKNLEDKKLLSQKIPGYLTASLISYALVEGPAFLNLIWFSTTGNMLYFAVTLTLLAYLLWHRPTKQKVENQLQLKGELMTQFRKENETYP